MTTETANPRAPLVDWNDENVAILKRMWSDGNSAAKIAAHISNATRSAVCGKVNRLGLAERETKTWMPHTRQGGSPGIAAERKPKPDPEPEPKPVRLHDARNDGNVVQRLREMRRKPEAQPLAGLPISDDATDLLIPAAQRRTLLTLEAGMCKWGVGDPLTAGFFFCGAPAEKRIDRWGNEHHKPYCRAHMARAVDTARTQRSSIKSAELDATFKPARGHLAGTKFI